MADTYTNWAALAAAKVENVDYRREVRRTSSRVSHIAIHGGAIEAGTSELASAVASATGGTYAALVGIQSANNTQLHITSTRFDEPLTVDVQRYAARTVSYHGLSGTDLVTHLGGGDADLKARIGQALTAAGFAVDWQTSEDVNGNDPLNITNRNASGMGVQLEMTAALRASFFPNGDTSRKMRESGQRTPAFAAYVDAVVSVVGPLDSVPLVPGDGAPDGQGDGDPVQPAAYRVVFADLLTDRVIDILQVAGLTFDTWIGKTGTLGGSLPVPDADMARRVRAATVPGRTAVWVERAGAVWWGGILWTATPSSDARGAVKVDIQAGSFESYFDHRLIFADQTFTQADQFTIARSLFRYAAAQPGGDIGIQLDAARSGVLRDRTYSRFDLPVVRDLLDQLAAVEGGFEWRISTYHDPASGRRTKALQLGYPVIRTGDAPIMLTHPGNVVSYSWPTDATGMATAWQSRGSTDTQSTTGDSVPLMSGVYMTTATAAGWPRLDGSSDYNSVNQLPTLNAHARADLAAAAAPVAIPAVTVRPDGQISPALLGAPVRLRVRDVWYPDGHDATYRVVGMAVTAATRGTAESAEIYLEAV
ncbi:poly-gamma-glutamate hydrolase family protein [Streptacidiphilus sp. P02-A3a]|uniref:poly-gamma-glutamate hydrolase family protein n=1 Tax=Streptacidiphilus sp. P02-A3a TaxID=2704468 RepID=UPI0015FB3809|nr:poly-gamma-glutamate hydrolase family protein [Streptacidiphilus sp. P02-A3a]